MLFTASTALSAASWDLETACFKNAAKIAGTMRFKPSARVISFVIIAAADPTQVVIAAHIVLLRNMSYLSEISFLIFKPM
tara:strand:- start:1672 stop:1911 length:240 start_codon:yes stop_codon:yes gene_type:complete